MVHRPSSCRDRAISVGRQDSERLGGQWLDRAEVPLVQGEHSSCPIPGGEDHDRRVGEPDAHVLVARCHCGRLRDIETVEFSQPVYAGSDVAENLELGANACPG